MKQQDKHHNKVISVKEKTFGIARLFGSPNLSDFCHAYLATFQGKVNSTCMVNLRTLGICGFGHFIPFYKSFSHPRCRPSLYLLPSMSAKFNDLDVRRFSLMKAKDGYPDFYCVLIFFKYF